MPSFNFKVILFMSSDLKVLHLLNNIFGIDLIFVVVVVVFT